MMSRRFRKNWTSWTIVNALMVTCSGVVAQDVTDAGENSLVVGRSDAHADVVQSARPSITGVDLDVLGSGEVLRFDLTHTLGTVPKSFALVNPSKIILDFDGVGSTLGRIKRVVQSAASNVLSYEIIPAGQRTSVIVDVKKSTAFNVALGKSRVSLGMQPVVDRSSRSSDMTVGKAAFQVSAAGSDAAPLKDVDFRRTQDGAGRIIVSLPNSKVSVDIQQDGAKLELDFANASLPQGLSRKMDVTDFGTPVNMITLQQAGDHVHMIVAVKGLWDNTVFQSDDTFIVDIKPKQANDKKSDADGYAGQKISLNFQNIDIRSLLQVIADFTKLNIVTSDSVTGNLTLRLQDVPWDQALDVILQAKGLGVRRTGNVLWIAPKEEIAAKEKLDLEAASSVQGLEPLKTQAFPINFAKAADIAQQISATTAAGGAAGSTPTRFLSPRGSAFAEPRTNQLFVTDIPGKLEEIRNLIDKFDVAVRQVVIVARIVEADDSFSRNLGVRIGGTDTRSAKGQIPGYPLNNAGDRIAFASSYNNLNPTTGAGGTMDPNANNVNLPADGINGNPAGALAFSIFNAAANRYLNLELSALEADGKGKIISSPRLVTADQTRAVIEQGTELPYQSATSSGATSVSFRKANLKLEVTPQITPEGNIILDLDVSKDSVGRYTSAGYAIDTKHVKTQVLVDNGGTVVIGGIFEEQTRNDVVKIPLLGDLPVLGVLFRKTDKLSSRREMLIFITPKVIQDNKIPKG